MGKYYCPCGAVLDTDEIAMKYKGDKNELALAMGELIDHFAHLKKYDKPPRYEE